MRDLWDDNDNGDSERRHTDGRQAPTTSIVPRHQPTWSDVINTKHFRSDVYVVRRSCQWRQTNEWRGITTSGYSVVSGVLNFRFWGRRFRGTSHHWRNYRCHDVIRTLGHVRRRWRHVSVSGLSNHRLRRSRGRCCRRDLQTGFGNCNTRTTDIRENSNISLRFICLQKKAHCSDANTKLAHTAKAKLNRIQRPLPLCTSCTPFRVREAVVVS